MDRPWFIPSSETHGRADLGNKKANLAKSGPTRDGNIFSELLVASPRPAKPPTKPYLQRICPSRGLSVSLEPMLYRTTSLEDRAPSRHHLGALSERKINQDNDQRKPMTKIKLLAGLVVGLALMAMSATPAGAVFRSLNGTSQGPGESSATSLTVGAAKVSCEKAEGEWHIQSKGKFEEHEQNGKQIAQAKGPHLYIKVSKWNNCKASISGIGVGAKVGACEFQIEQEQEGVLKGTATVIHECQIQTAEEKGVKACTIHVFAGKESQKEPINAFLPGISFENSGTSLLTTSLVENIHGKASCLTPEEFVGGKFESAKGGIIGKELNEV
jgi:hypothetical protein